MTDSCRIPSLYYSAENYNNGITNINASDDKQLVVPLIENGDSQNWQVAIAKLRAPLGTIPLTQANIGLKKYQIILRNGQYEGSAFVRQLNATSGNLCYSLTGTVLSKYSYTSTVITLVATQNLSTVCVYPNNVFLDDFLNVYISGSNTNPNANNLFVVIDANTTPNVLVSLPFTNIKSIYIDRNQKVYVSDDTANGTLVTVFNNNNGVNQVQLTVLGVISTDFAGAILNNSIFVVATDNTIIIGHDTTTISYYTSLLAPIIDYQIVGGHQLTAANVLNSDGTLLVADSSQLADSLFGTQALEVWNVETNTQQTAGTIISHAAITTTGYAFVVSSADNFTYGCAYPFVPIANFFTVETSTPILRLATNQTALYACSTTYHLLALNLDFTNSSIWYDFTGVFTIGGLNMLDMDWNTNNNIVAVTQSNTAFISHLPVYPISLTFIDNLGTPLIYGINFNIGTPIPPGQTSILPITTAPSLTNTKACAVSPSGTYYFIQTTGGQDVVVSCNQLNYAMALINTFVIGENVLTGICIVGSYLCVIGGSSAAYVYTIDTTTIVVSISATGPITAIADLDGISLLAISYHVAGNPYLMIYNIATLSIVSQTQIPAISGIVNSMVVDKGYTFIGYNTHPIFTSIITGGNTSQIDYYQYTDNYAVLRGILPISTYTGLVQSLTCNSNIGQVYMYLNNNGVCSSVLYARQGGNYQANVYNLSTPPQGCKFMMVPPNISGTIGWDAIASNIQVKSIAVSKTSPNTLYAIDVATSTVFKGSLVSGSVTFTQIALFAGQNSYTFISTVRNTATNVNLTLRSFTVNNQTPLQTLALVGPQILSIARNDENNEYIVPLTGANQLNSYPSNLVLNYSLTLSSPIKIFVKNSEDVNVPNVSIYTLQTVVDQINLAFYDAWVALSTAGGNLSESPNLELNNTGYLTLNYSTDYTQPNNGILFNNPLNYLCFFSSALDTIDLGFYLLKLPNPSTALTQLSRSIFNFNLLDKLLIHSISLFVSGSYYGTNSVSQVLSDIDIPTDGAGFANGNVGQVLFYQPNFLRCFQIGSGGCSLDRIQITLYYRYRDGTEYVLQLPPGEAFSCKLQFVRKF